MTTTKDKYILKLAYFIKKVYIITYTIYSINGTKKTYNGYNFNSTECFDITIYNDEHQTKYYPGDELLLDIDCELSLLREHFGRKTFNGDKYFNSIKNMPIYLTAAGLSSNFSMSKEEYESITKKHINDEDYRKHVYVADVQYLISAVQNLLIGLDNNFTDYYCLISEIDFPSSILNTDGTYITSGEKVERLLSVLGSYYVKLYSIMDLITKIEYEFECPFSNDERFLKLKSNSILYNNKKLLRINNKPGTLFEKDEMLTEIESIRNEIVHNGMWEDGGKVFADIKNSEIKERYIFYPDMINGRFVSSTNRHHFFSAGIKVNDVLPNVHKKFLIKLKETINVIEKENNI